MPYDVARLRLFSCPAFSGSWIWLANETLEANRLRPLAFTKYVTGSVSFCEESSYDCLSESVLQFVFFFFVKER